MFDVIPHHVSFAFEMMSIAEVYTSGGGDIVIIKILVIIV
jgi:hypothetical protein